MAPCCQPPFSAAFTSPDLIKQAADKRRDGNFRILIGDGFRHHSRLDFCLELTKGYRTAQETSGAETACRDGLNSLPRPSLINKPALFAIQLLNIKYQVPIKRLGNCAELKTKTLRHSTEIRQEHLSCPAATHAASTCSSLHYSQSLLDYGRWLFRCTAGRSRNRASHLLDCGTGLRRQFAARFSPSRFSESAF